MAWHDGSDAAQGAGDVGHHDLRVAGVLPDVGVAVRVALAARSQGHPRAGIHHRGVAVGAGDGVVEPLLEPDAVLDDDVGAGQGIQVGRGGLVVVGVDVGLEHAVDVDAVTADDPGEVGDLGGGGHHADLRSRQGLVAG